MKVDRANLEKYMSDFVDLQLKVQSKTAATLPKLKDKLASEIKNLKALDATARYELLTRLESMPKDVTKASAVKKLKQITKSDYVVVFGDGINDLEMFGAADECYAMANAEPELKAVATKIIESNDNDGVAHWLAEKEI